MWLPFGIAPCSARALSLPVPVGHDLPGEQGGIYNLPSHLSPGARDLIPRMLLVDPLKRITIPEIRCARTQDALNNLSKVSLQHVSAEAETNR